MSVTVASGRLGLVQALIRNIRSPESGLAGQGIRFVLAGGLVASVNVSVTILLHLVVGLEFQLALAISYAVTIALHFTLQRRFVWTHQDGFGLAMRHQAVRYLLVCIAQYGLVALVTAQLPRLLGVSVEPVYLGTVVGIAVINFVVFRGRVFHAGPAREAESAQEVKLHA